MLSVDREIERCATSIMQSETPMKNALTELQAEIIKRALKLQKGNRTHTADILGIERATLNAQIKKLRQLGLLTDQEMKGLENG